MMKKLFLVLCATMLAGCTSAPIEPISDENRGLIVATTIEPYAMHARALVADDDVVVQIMPTGSDPHTRSPTPKEMQQLFDADIVIANGLMLEAQLKLLLEALEKEGKTILYMEDVSALIPYDDGHDHDEESHQDDEHDEHGDHDPHIWLSVENTLKHIEYLSTSLAKKKPSNATLYQQKAQEYAISLQPLMQMQKEFSLGVERFYLYHDAYAYLFGELGIERERYVLLSKNHNHFPSEKELAELKENNTISHMFVDRAVEKTSEVKKIATFLEVEVFSLDPYSAKSYYELVSNIISALSQEGKK